MNRLLVYFSGISCLKINCGMTSRVHLSQLRTKDYCATAQDKVREFMDGTDTCGGNDRALELCGMTK